MNKEREKMKRYLEQLATIKDALQSLFLMSADMSYLDLMRDERLTMLDCDEAINTLLGVIYEYCEKWLSK